MRAGLALALALVQPATAGAEGRHVTVTGEAIDTWCYFSGVMGGPDAVVGSAHHTCALWCAAGGIPVGLLADDGTVYMVLKLPGADDAAGGRGFLAVASHRLTASGMLHERDGIRYIIISEVIEDHGITRRNHEDFGVVPPFAIPEAGGE
ncbi:MAG: hypothetical protein D6686_15895 [Alphaproteobacteria bacterium]|nr:MAG: hypothetical protein D6686_15895 [Alphaproteobacteria bacterium]